MPHTALEKTDLEVKVKISCLLGQKHKQDHFGLGNRQLHFDREGWLYLMGSEKGDGKLLVQIL